MPSTDSFQIASLLANLIGAIGGVLGIASWLKTHQKEHEEDELWAFLAEIRKSQDKRKEGGINVFNFPAGSKEWQRAEKLVERGLLGRPLSGGGYTLPELTGFYNPSS